MRNLLFCAASAGALFSAGVAHAACGDVTLSVFSWQSAEAMSNVDQFILKNGYGCNATAVAGDTVFHVRGRVVALRSTGGLAFPRIRDRSG